MKKLAKRAALLATTASILAGASAASAQDIGSPASAEASDDQIIVVTGTRIAVDPNLETAIPIVSISAESIEKSGLTNMTSLLAQTPALFNSETNFDAAGSQARFGGAGVNLLNLRNLGPNRTLVLVNGRRHVAGVPGEAAVDINTIPVALIDRVDVLTGGISAIYGADGVSGVVNFVMKRDFEGMDFRAHQGVSKFGDAPSTLISGTVGKNFDGGRGNIALSYEYRRDGRVAYSDRPFGKPDTYFFVRNPNDIPDDPNIPDEVLLNNIGYFGSSRDGGVYVSPLPFFFEDAAPEFRGGGQPYNAGLFLPESGFFGAGGDNTPIADYQGDLQAGIKQHNFNLVTSYELTPSVRVYAEGKYVASKAFTVGQPSFDFFTYVPADNAFIPASIQSAIAPGNLLFLPDGVLVNRDNFDLGRRNERVSRDLFRGVLGFDGDLSDTIRFDVSYTYGQNKFTFINENTRLTDRYFAALDSVDEGAFLTGTPNGNIVCRADLTGGFVNTFSVANLFDDNPFNDFSSPQTYTPGDGSCQPLNIFGEGVGSQAAIDFINVDLRNRVKLEQHVINGYVSGDFAGAFEMPGGPVGFALGGEYRKEKSSFRPDDIAKQSVDIDPMTSVVQDLALLADEDGSFDVWEVFGEIRLPILSDVPFAHRLDVGAAIRFSDYSTIGSTTTWKVDGSWAPIPDITLRGSYSEAVRAPNITELFAPTQGGFSFLTDPCSPVNVNNGSEFRAANCRALIEGLGVDYDSFDFDSDIASSAGILGVSSGNADLSEEKAKTWTAGIVLQPQSVRGLALSFDWYDIRLTNAVNTATLQQTTEFCVDAPTLDNAFCNNITRDSLTGFVVDYLVRPENVAFFETAGADMTVAYSLDAGKWGSFAMRGTVGYLDKLKFLPANGGTVDNDRGEIGAPKWVGTGDITWSLENFEVNYGLNYIGHQRRYEYDETANDPDIVDPQYLYVRSVVTHDLQFAATTSDDKATFYVGVNNLTNELPSIGLSNTPVSFLGRFFYAGIRINTDKLGFGL